MEIAIHEVLGLDVREATRGPQRFGMVAVDDISEGLIDHAWNEILDGPGQAADDMPLETERIETGWGPVFVMRNPERVSAAEDRRDAIVKS